MGAAQDLVVEQVDGTAGDCVSAPSRRHVVRDTALVAALALVGYGLTLSAVPALTHDSLTYLKAIEQGGPGLFHPHHLAYNGVSRAWLNLARAVGVDGDPLQVIEMLNAGFGACAATLVWLILRLRAGLSRPLAAAATAGASLSFGVWFYSVSVEVYLLPLVLVLATFLALSTPVLSVQRLALVGLLNGLAVIGHQINVLFAVVVLVAAVRGVDRGAAVRRMAAYGMTATAVVGAAYGSVLAWSVHARSPSEARGWFAHYAESGRYWELSPAAPVKAVVGHTRSIVGGHFAFRIESVRERMLSAFSDRSLDDEAFLVRNLPSMAAWALIALAGLAMGLLVVAIVRGVRHRRDLPPAARRLLPLLGVWWAVYAAFFVFWEPVNLEFWIPQATVVWMVAATASARTATSATTGRRRSLPGAAPALAAAAVAVAVVNLAGTILPATDAGNDVYALRYTALADLVGDGDVVVVEYPHLGVPYTDRLTDANAVSIPLYSPIIELHEREDPSPDELVDRLDETLAEGGRVAVDPVLIDRPDNDRSRALGRELEDRFADRWRRVEVPGADGWLIIDS